MLDKELEIVKFTIKPIGKTMKQEEILKKFDEELAERKANYKARMAKLTKLIQEGKAGVVREYGQLHIEVGDDTTWEEAFGIVNNGTKLENI